MQPVQRMLSLDKMHFGLLHDLHQLNWQLEIKCVPCLGVHCQKFDPLLFPAVWCRSPGAKLPPSRKSTTAVPAPDRPSYVPHIGPPATSCLVLFYPSFPSQPRIIFRNFLLSTVRSFLHVSFLKIQAVWILNSPTRRSLLTLSSTPSLLPTACRPQLQQPRPGPSTKSARRHAPSGLPRPRSTV